MRGNYIINRFHKKFLHLRRSLLQKTSFDLFGPSTVRIYPIHYLCNHSCPMCWRSNKVSPDIRNEMIELEKKTLKISEYRRVIATLPPTTDSVEIVGGGEPLLYKEIEQLTTIIKKSYLSGSLITNGVLLREKLINHLLRIKWDSVRISVHASDPEIYKLINGVNSFDTVLNNIKLFIKKRSVIRNDNSFKTRIGVLMVIQRDNYKNIYNFSRLAENIGCDFIEFDTIYPYTESMMLSKNEAHEAMGLLEKTVKNISTNNNAYSAIELYRSHPHTVRKRQKHFIKYYKNKKCVLPSKVMILDSFGRAHICCFLVNPDSGPKDIDGGGFRKVKSIWSIWRNKSYLENRNQLKSGKFFETCMKYCNYALPKY